MDITAMIGDLNQAFEAFKGRYEHRLSDLEAGIDAIEAGVAKSFLPAGPGNGRTSGASAEHAKKFFGWVRKGSDPDGLRSLEVQAGLSTQSDPDGGFLVPEETDKELDKLAIDTVAMRRLARIITASGDYKRPFSAGGATGGWVGESDTRSETDTPELKLFQPPWSELYALPEVTQALLDMSDFDVEGWLQDELFDVETEMEGAAFITGNGVKQPKGFLDYTTVADSSWEWGKIGYIAGGTASTLSDADKLLSLQHSLKPVYRKNGVWLMNDTTMETVRKFKNGNGNYLFRPGIELNAPDTLLGKPVEIDDNMPDIGTNAYPIAFGDFKRGYTIGDHKVGRRVLRDPYTKKGWVKFYLVKRVFGGVTNFQAIKLLKIATS